MIRTVILILLVLLALLVGFDLGQQGSDSKIKVWDRSFVGSGTVLV